MIHPSQLAPVSGAPRLLVSVADVEEARLAAQAGVDFIDLKDPRAGALGGLPVDALGAIVTALRAARHGAALSATIGDWPATAVDTILARVVAVAASGVDIVKVGIEPGPAAPALLAALRAVPHTVVPVFIADAGVAPALVAQAAALGFPALMLDTADKRAGSLLERLPDGDLRGVLRQAHDAGCAMGLAGALRRADWPRLAALGADFAGFRSAVCAGWRGGALDAGLLARLVSVARGEQAA